MKKSDIKKVKLGDNITFGDGKVYIQSMLNKPSHDVDGNVLQAKELKRAGCEIVRVAIPDKNAIKLIHKIKDKVDIPIVADIHFDYRLALLSAKAGADKIRINPGNIGSFERVKEVSKTCRNKNIPIRVGINGGSIERELLDLYHRNPAQAMVKSALKSVKILNDTDFDDIVISIKSSDVKTMIQGYELLHEQCKYPLHLGVTEAGDESIGKIKSAIGIGSLLAKGIGDTIRVSLTGDPVKEVLVANEILKALNLKENEITYISCPTCGRTQIDVIGILKKVQNRLKDVHKPIKVAIMGCVVNGPGEAKEADIGIAGAKDEAVLFKKGRALQKIKSEKIVEVLVDEIKNM